MVDGTYKREANQSILNTGPTSILLRLLPLIRKQELQVTMADNVATSCVCSDYSRMQCCNDGILSMVLDALEARESLHRKTQGRRTVHVIFFFCRRFCCCCFFKHFQRVDISFLKIFICHTYVKPQRSFVPHQPASGMLY